MHRPTALRGIAYAALALLVATILAPLGSSQSAGPLIQVAVNATPDDFVIRKSHGSTVFTFVIGFTCQSGPGSYGPCTGQVGQTDVEVTLASLPEGEPPPDGWTVTWSGLERFRMKASENRTITSTVQLDEDEPEDDQFPLGLSVAAQPVTNSGLDPLLGGVSGQSSRAAASVEVSKVLNFGEQLTSWARNYMWPLLGAAVILLVAGVVLVERKRGSLGLASDAPSQPVQPGRGTSFPIRLHNESKGEDRVGLAVANLPPEWTAIVPLSELDLRGGERTQMWITVRAPPEATPGQSLSFTLRARSLRGQRSADLPLQVTVVGGTSHPPIEVLAPPPPPPPIEYGEETIEAEPRPRRRRS